MNNSNKPITPPVPLAIIDVHYTDAGAHGAVVVVDNWGTDTPIETGTCLQPGAAEYVPGQFYKRELPVILTLIDSLQTEIEAIMVDGYVYLSETHTPGLGAHLYQALEHKLPVIGVAKNPYRRSEFAIPVVRGESLKPLFVTTVDMDEAATAQWVKQMHGPYRIPTLLGMVDKLARDV